MKDDSKLTMLLEWSAHFLKCFHSSSVSTSQFMQTVNRRYWVILSESDLVLLKNWQLTRNPRVSSDQTSGDQQQYHDIMSECSQSLSVLASGSLSSLQLSWRFSIRIVLR